MTYFRIIIVKKCMVILDFRRPGLTPQSLSLTAVAATPVLVDASDNWGKNLDQTLGPSIEVDPLFSSSSKPLWWESEP